MDQFRLTIAMLGILKLTTSMSRVYELKLADCKSSNVVFHWLNVALNEHRANGAAKHYYQRDEDSAVWKWLSKLGENGWTEPVHLGAVTQALQHCWMQKKPVDRQVIESEWVALALR